MTVTQPDIAYTIGWLAAFIANPSMAHYSAVKKVIRYLAGMRDYGIMYSTKPTHLQNKDLFFRYADARFNNQLEGQSMSGYVFILYGGAIMWGFQKQNIVAFLTGTEAKYIMLSETGHEAVWLLNLYKELGFNQGTILLIGDNQESIGIAQELKFH